MVRWEEEKKMPEAMKEVETPRRAGVRGRSGWDVCVDMVDIGLQEWGVLLRIRIQIG